MIIHLLAQGNQQLILVLNYIYYSQVDHGYDVSWLSELRQVSVLFINLDPDFSLPTDIVSRKTKEQTLLQTAFESIYPNLVKYNGKGSWCLV